MTFYKHPEREKRLNSYVGENKIFYDFPLTKVLKFTKYEFEDLISVTNLYLWESLKGSFKKKTFNLSEDILKKYKNFLIQLPNRTKNGIILPYFENYKSYNILHETLKSIFKKRGLLENLSSVQTTFKVRLLNSKKPKNFNNNYSTEKIHTDVWNNEPSSSILFNIPLMGNTNKIGLNFYHPQKRISDFDKRFNNYDEAKYLYKYIKHYSFPFKKGFIYLSDAFSLHSTKYSKLSKNKDNVRLSIDVRGIFKKKIGNEKYEDFEKAPEPFLPINEWLEISNNQILVNKLPINSFIRKMSGEKVKSNKIRILNYTYSKS